MGSNIYYKGSDGNYYVKCLENACREDIQYSNNVPVLSKDLNSYKYFKVEPIKWRVVDSDFDHDQNSATEGKKILVAETILTGNINFYYYDKTMRLKESLKDKYNKKEFILNGMLATSAKQLLLDVYPNNYKYSKIRAFLNGLGYEIRPNDSSLQSTSYIYKDKGFLQTAFTDKAQAFIEITTVDNSKNSAGYKVDEYIDYSCENTYDKVFLLSTKEQYSYNLLTKVTSTSCSAGYYYVSKIQTVTDYAKANYVWVKNESGIFFYRTPNYSASSWENLNKVCMSAEYPYGRCLIKNGRFIEIENHVGADGYNQIGIVPAIAVDF